MAGLSSRYKSGGCSGASNTQCSTCATCASGKYKSGGCSGTSNTACATCATCGNGKYQTRACSFASNRQCATCSNTNCAAGQYRSGSCSGTTNGYKCTSWGKCGAGLAWTKGSATKDRTCQLCVSGTFQSSSGHQSTRCTPWAKCGRGFYFVAGTSSRDRTCEQCPTGTFQSSGSHQDRSCKRWGTCGAGFAFVVGSSTADRTCKPCAAGTYQGRFGHQTTTCPPHQQCGRGTFVKGASSKTKGSCAICPDGSYEDRAEHRSTLSSCKAALRCSKGQKLSGASKTQRGKCLPCDKTAEYQDKTGHFETVCLDQIFCTRGQKIVDHGPDAKATCAPCSWPQTYQRLDKHRAASCTPQTKCGRGQMLVQVDDRTLEGKCAACPPGTFQDADQHLEQKCVANAVCAPEFVLRSATTAAKGVCEPCPPDAYNFTFQPHSQSWPCRDLKCHGSRAALPGACKTAGSRSVGVGLSMTCYQKDATGGPATLPSPSGSTACPTVPDVVVQEDGRNGQRVNGSLDTLVLDVSGTFTLPRIDPGSYDCDKQCGCGFSWTNLKLDGASKDWSTPAKNIGECAAACSTRAGCTAFRFKKGGAQRQVCGTFTGGNADLRTAQKDPWVSCFTGDAPGAIVISGAPWPELMDGALEITANWSGVEAHFNNRQPHAGVAVEYTAKDRQGSVAASTVRTVVLVDRTAPVITVPGNQTSPDAPLFQQAAQAGKVMAAPAVTAYDVVDGNVTDSVTSFAVREDKGATVAWPDLGVTGDYTITYTATDAHDNTAERKLFVRVADTLPPQLRLVERQGDPLNSSSRITEWLREHGVTPVTAGAARTRGKAAGKTSFEQVAAISDGVTSWEFGVPWKEPGFVATDNHVGPDEMQSRVRTALQSYTDVKAAVGTISQVKYVVADDDGNEAHAVRSVIIVDTLPPTVKLLGRRGMAVTQGDGSGAFQDPGVYATDIHDGSYAGDMVDIAGTPDTASLREQCALKICRLGLLDAQGTKESPFPAPGVFTIEYIVVDGHGNVSTAPHPPTHTHLSSAHAH